MRGLKCTVNTGFAIMIFRRLATFTACSGCHDGSITEKSRHSPMYVNKFELREQCTDKKTEKNCRGKDTTSLQTLQNLLVINLVFVIETF